MPTDVENTAITEIKQATKIQLRQIERELFKKHMAISLLYAITAVLAVLTICFILDKNYVSVLMLLLYVSFIAIWTSIIEKERQKLMEKKYVFLFLNHIPERSFQSQSIDAEYENEN